MHPLLELILNPFAGAAGFNLLACMFYLSLVLIALVALVERSLRSK